MEKKKRSTPVNAVIFDLDGTLLDTERATKDVLKDFLAGYGKAQDAKKEERRLGMMFKESAVGIVEDYALPMTAAEYGAAIMPLYQQRWYQAKALPGVNRLLRHLHSQGVPLALASNSIKKHIDMKISHQQGWKEMFSVIIGGDEVNNGKPAPDIFLEAAKRLGVDPSQCLVIEDSVVGVRAAKASGAKVVAVPSLRNQDDHYSIANCILRSLLDFQPELWGLPEFEDWVQKVLPIEPLDIEGLIGEGIVHDEYTSFKIISDDIWLASLPDQVSGFFFGSVKLQKQGVFKAIAAIGWDSSSGTSMRAMQLCIFGRLTNNSPSEERFVMKVIGYIRKISNEENTSEALKLCKEDIDIAQTASERFEFSHQMDSPSLAEEALGNEA